MRFINLSENGITKVENLQHCDELITLNLCQNQISEVKELPFSLKSLDLSQNQIEVLPILPNQLIALHLSANLFNEKDQIKNL